MYRRLRDLVDVARGEHALIVGPAPCVDLDLARSWMHGTTIAVNDVISVLDPAYWLFKERVMYRRHRGSARARACSIVCTEPWRFTDVVPDCRLYRYEHVRRYKSWSILPDALFGVISIALTAISLAYRLGCTSVQLTGMPMRRIDGMLYHEELSAFCVDESETRKERHWRRRFERALNDRMWGDKRVVKDPHYGEV